MTQVTLSPPASDEGLRGAWNRIADTLSAVVNHASLALIDRIAIAAISSFPDAPRWRDS
jgi:hypothetical protein